ncbi:MAG: PepSY domain-containing protein [Acidimicrobiia bacterium]|nr:PepSY domain-containing protein [Acidimicrobiia bacterium]
MQKRTKVMLAGGVLAAAAFGIPTAASAGNDVDTPITGSALESASAAALDHLGEGTVTETEVGDEESMYEVEVTLSDGRQVDVQLDEGFHVVGSEADQEGANDTD